MGTYWHARDARAPGFTPKSPNSPSTVDRVIQHVARAALDTPFVSLTRSYGVAYSYAIYFGRLLATAKTPAYVYELEINERLAVGLPLIDPLQAIVKNSPALPGQMPYEHDGDMDFILGVVNPNQMAHFLERPVKQPPPGAGAPRAANLSIELETIVRTLRDAEILACGTVPPGCIVSRHEVWLEM